MRYFGFLRNLNMTMLLRHCENRASDSWQSTIKNNKKRCLAIFHYKLLCATNCAFDDAPPASPPQREEKTIDCHSDLTNPLAMTINTCLISFYFHHTYSKSLKTPHLKSVFFFFCSILAVVFYHFSALQARQTQLH